MDGSRMVANAKMSRCFCQQTERNLCLEVWKYEKNRCCNNYSYFCKKLFIPWLNFWMLEQKHLSSVQWQQNPPHLTCVFWVPELMAYCNLHMTAEYVTTFKKQNIQTTLTWWKFLTSLKPSSDSEYKNPLLRPSSLLQSFQAKTFEETVYFWFGIRLSRWPAQFNNLKAWVKKEARTAANRYSIHRWLQTVMWLLFL